jgi:hypothetical protein
LAPGNIYSRKHSERTVCVIDFFTEKQEKLVKFQYDSGATGVMSVEDFEFLYPYWVGEIS